jgi:radical SAM superfamily enzyme YgiQ (UPF0313 family)
LEPIGLLYLATYIREKLSKKYPSIKVSIVDTYFNGPPACTKTKLGYRAGLSDEEIEEILKKEKPDMIGISNNYTSYTPDSLSLAELAKKTCPKAVIVLGGAHATVDHEFLITKDCVDVVVRGEGEETFREMIYNIYKKKGLRNVLGITYKEGKRIISNSDRPLIEDLDELPIPDRSFINYPEYLKKTSEIYFVPEKKPVGTIFSSRGCMYHCVFCSTHKVWSDKWRYRSAKNVIKEINYLRKKYGVREFAFEDDQFLGSNERVVEICKMIIKQKMDISLIVPPGLSPSLLKKETLKYLKQAGLYRVSFSVDAGSPKSVAYVKKPVNLDKVRDIVAYANRLGLWTYGFFVIGYPYETIKDLEEVRDYAYGLKMDFIRFYIAQPHMGSDLYEIYLKEGKIDKRAKEQHTMFDSLFGTDHVSAKKLFRLREEYENSYLLYHIKNHLPSLKYFFWEFIPKISSPKKIFYLFRVMVSYTKQISITPSKK